MTGGLVKIICSAVAADAILTLIFIVIRIIIYLIVVPTVAVVVDSVI